MQSYFFFLPLELMKINSDDLNVRSSGQYHSDFLATLAVFQKINLFIGKKAVACQKSNK